MSIFGWVVKGFSRAKQVILEWVQISNERVKAEILKALEDLDVGGSLLLMIDWTRCSETYMMVLTYLIESGKSIVIVTTTRPREWWLKIIELSTIDLSKVTIVDLTGHVLHSEKKDAEKRVPMFSTESFDEIDNALQSLKTKDKLVMVDSLIPLRLYYPSRRSAAILSKLKNTAAQNDAKLLLMCSASGIRYGLMKLVEKVIYLW